MGDASFPASTSLLHKVHADLLIPGNGEPVQKGAVVWGGGKIIYAGPQSSVPDMYRQVQAIDVPVVMPGMWDCHIHFVGSPVATPENIIGVSQALAGIRSVPDARATLMAGFTSVRELAGYGCELAKAIDEGRIVGPTIYSSRCAISMTAGHGDAHSMKLESVKDLCAHGVPFCVADGVDECRLAVRKALRGGARVIKVCASGGVASTIDDPINQQYSHEELEAIVDEAARAHRIVAAHCHGKAGIMAALHAGCKTIEHGSYLDEEAVDLMIKKDAMLVATRTAIEGGLQLRDIWSPTSFQKLQDLADSHARAYKLAVKRGVKIALGNDFFISSQEGPFAFGKNGLELVYAVDAGMTPLQAITAATASGPLTLGEQAPLSGQLKEGYDADIITVSADPLQDISIMSRPENITHIWKAGKLVKSPKWQAEL